MPVKVVELYCKTFYSHINKLSTLKNFSVTLSTVIKLYVKLSTVIKLFCKTLYSCKLYCKTSYKCKMFVTFVHFHPSLMFEGKAGAHPCEAYHGTAIKG